MRVPVKPREGWFQRLTQKLRYTSFLNVATRILPSFVHTPLRRIYIWIIRPRISLNQERLQEIIARHSSARVMIVFPPSLDWSAQMFQRPQQIASALAANGALVFYLQHRENWDETPFRQIQPNLYLCNIPVETFHDLQGAYVYLFTWSSRFRHAFRSPRILYDYVDDLHTFPGSYSHMLHEHKRLLRVAKHVLVTSERLLNETLTIRPDAFLCPNGVDYEHFCQARNPTQEPAPQEMRLILEGGKHIIGYHGALAAWFDYDLLEHAASVLQDCNFVLIGPDHDNSLPTSLLERANIHWLGMKPYRELPDYLRCFDAAMIPFRLSDITHATSPIKLFEYFAAGKPVVITAMQESMRYPIALVATRPDDFIDKLTWALALRTDPSFLDVSDRAARDNTWEARASQILERINL